ncbi:MAG: glycosyltransferase [Pseudomonadota bacterium]
MQRRYLRTFGGQRGKQVATDRGAQEAAAAEPAAAADIEVAQLQRGGSAGGDFKPLFHIDRYGYGDVAGWATDPATPDRPVSIHFAIKGVLVGVARADIVRADVANAGHAPKHCGFQWRIPSPVADAAISEREAIHLSAVSASGQEREIAAIRLRDDPSVSDTARELALPALEKAMVRASVAALEGGGPVTRHEPSTYPLHEAMFSFDGAASGNVSHTLSPYPAFTHRRLHKGPTHPLDGSEAAKNAYLRWYIDEYGSARAPMRIPLGADEIAYLNEPVQMVGVPFKVSRISLSYALGDPDAIDFMPLSDIERYEAFVAWWSTVKAPELNVEDCLVPDYYVEALRRMTPNWMGKGFAFSQMMMRSFRDDGAEEVLDIAIEADRVLFHVWFLLDAIDDPGRIRFIPTRNLNALFEGPPGETQFDKVVQSIYGSGGQLAEVFDARSFSDLLWRSGFDLTRRRFIFWDAKGNRFEAARFPPATTPQAERVPLQVIGPFQKSSGLGQASRLSAEIVRHTGIDAHFVDFGLDNPAPTGMTQNRVEDGAPVPAQVNLIHLNGETVPIALAYMRDVFNGAYNIGYFFWELSTPALSQYLALDILDEIWVATEYGVSIYKPAVDKPVFNAGMAVEPIDVPSREEARAYVQERLPIGQDTFVYLSAFDSFSFLERKNPHGVVEAFQAAFDQDEDVLLVLKTHNRDFVLDAHQAMRWERIVEIAAADPRIVLLNETLQYEDLIKLKTGCDCFVSLHRSEGWGFGLVESMTVGLPVVSTGYSGNLDFTTPENSWLVDYDLIEPRENEYLFVERGQQWAAPKLESAVQQLRAVRADPTERDKRVSAARAFVGEKFSFKERAAAYKTRLDEIFAAIQKR